METDQILKQLRVGTWEVDLISHKISWSEVTRLIHDTPENFELNYDSVLKFYKKGPSRDNVQVLFSEIIENGVPFEEDFEFVTYTGRPITVRTRCKAIFENGVCVRLIGTIRDVTYIKKSRKRVKAQIQ